MEMHNRTVQNSKEPINKPEEILNSWINNVNKGDLEGLLNMYNQNAVLFPTFSNKLNNTPEKIRDYFQNLRERRSLSVSLHEKTISTQLVNDSTYVLSGIYLWKFYVEEELLSFEARFTFVMDTSLTSPIVHHHSSQVPRML
jgi:hypothetical protein